MLAEKPLRMQPTYVVRSYAYQFPCYHAHVITWIWNHYGLCLPVEYSSFNALQKSLLFRLLSIKQQNQFMIQIWFFVLVFQTIISYANLAQLVVPDQHLVNYFSSVTSRIFKYKTEFSAMNVLTLLMLLQLQVYLITITNYP